MKMTEYEVCPKCGSREVFAEHHQNKWIIRCAHCNLHTEEYESHDLARKEWDKGVENVNT